MKDLNINLLLDFYGDLLSPSSLEYMTLYYNEDLSLSEIAETAGITRQGVRDSIKRSEETLLKYEQKLGLALRFSKMQSDVEDIKVMLRELLCKIPEHSDEMERIITKAETILSHQQ